MSRVPFCLLILVLVANSALSSWSGDISLKRAYLRPISESKYVLTLNHLDGTVLTVVVEKLSTVQYALQGEILRSGPKPRFSKNAVKMIYEKIKKGIEIIKDIKKSKSTDTADTTEK